VIRELTTPLQEHAEVDSMRDRYSPMRYIAHLKGAMVGEFRGRGEWSRVLRNMPADDAVAFWFEFDELAESGAWVKVLDAEEREQVKERVLAKVDEWRALSSSLQSGDYGIPAALMHQIANDPDFEPGEEEMDDAEAEAWLEDVVEEDSGWPEDIEDADIGKGEER
jgi:hypothetical protein